MSGVTADDKGMEQSMANVPAGWLRFDTNGTILSTNNYLRALLGYGPSELEQALIGTILTGGARVFLQTHVLPSLQVNGTVEEIYLSLKAKDGRSIPILLNVVSKENADGRIINNCLLVHITRRSKFEDELIVAKKNAEEATKQKEVALMEQRIIDRKLRDHVERLRIATDLSGITITEIDYINNEVHLSKEAAELYGLGNEPLTVPRSTLHGTFHPADRAALLELLSNRRDPSSEGWFAMEHRIIVDNDQVRWISVQKQIYFENKDGRSIASRGVLVARDITERKATTDMVKEGESRMLIATAATGVGIWQWNVMNGNVLCDPQMFRIIGKKPSLDGMMDFEDWLSNIHPEDIEETQRIFTERLKKAGTWRSMYRIIRADGETRYIEAVHTVHSNEEGKTEWVLGTNLDITERVELEGELRAAHRRKDEFLATLAHELRNPLSPIKSGLQLLEEDSQDMPGHAGTIAMMSRQMHHMIRLVDDLMDLSRITSGKIGLRKKNIDLKKVINTSIEASEPLIEQMGHQFFADVPEGNFYIDGDAVRIAQVINNLLNNAAKYTPHGGRIDLTLSREAAHAVITVEDNGIGITPEQLTTIFDMFAQAPLSKSTSGSGGLGIGLNIVKRLVEMHKGQITGTSNGMDQGSSFTVKFPLVENEKVVSGPKKVSTTQQLQHKRILMVDDNEDAALVMSMLLKRQGHEVELAYDGETAVKIGERFVPNVVIMDIGMPKMNGYEACSLMRKTDWGKNAYIVALSGWGQDDDKQRSKKAGFDKHLVKPIEAKVLNRIVAMSDVNA